MRVVRCKLERRQAIVEIGLQKFVPSARNLQSQDAATAFPVNRYRALIDTGAQRTCLSRSAIAIENLSSHGKRAIQNVHNQQLHRLYFINLGFVCEIERPDGGENDVSYYAMETPCEVINIADNEYFDVILGMDILEQFDFRFHKTGEFLLQIP